MEGTSHTDDQILSAFLRLTAERGLDAVTTREIAEAAGVNPVTLFRRFGDKTTIAVEAIRRYSPAARLQSHDPAVDPADAAEGLLAALLFLADLSRNHSSMPWIRLGMLQVSQLPEVRAELTAVVKAIYGYLRRALAQAAPALRPEVDHHVTALQWMGLLMAARRMSEFGDDQSAQLQDWGALFRAAIRPLLCEV